MDTMSKLHSYAFVFIICAAKGLHHCSVLHPMFHVWTKGARTILTSGPCILLCQSFHFQGPHQTHMNSNSTTVQRIEPAILSTVLTVCLNTTDRSF